MADQFRSHRDIIDAWPRLSDFAADAGVTYGAAKAMRRRDRIGIEYVAAVVSGAAARGIEGVSAELIAQLAAAKASNKRGAQSSSSNSEQVTS
jgi:hypothetical protein